MTVFCGCSDDVNGGDGGAKRMSGGGDGEDQPADELHVAMMIAIWAEKARTRLLITWESSQAMRLQFRCEIQTGKPESLGVP